ncbi:MAG: VOC family protein, partial [Chloroflexota bacterium]|nr:VOC family protein [Chloroflexota bacterium]
EKKPEYAGLSKDGMVIMFIPAKNAGVKCGAKVGAGVNFYMEIDGDIDEYYNDLKRKDVRITADIKDEPFGIRDFTIADPNGYQLTFNKQLQAK